MIPLSRSQAGNAQLREGQRQASVLNYKSKRLGFLGDKRRLGVEILFSQFELGMPFSH